MGHVYSGMAQYPHWQGARLFNIPWWVPLEFAGAAFLLIQVEPFKKKNFKLSTPERIASTSFWVSVLWTLSIYLGTSLIPESHPLAKNALLFVAFSAQVLWARMFYVGSLLEILSVAAAGCAAEIFLGKMEVFTYFPSPSIVGMIPAWLGLIYGSAAVTIRLFCATALNEKW